LQAELEAEFPPVSDLLDDVLTYCDITTTPDGELTGAEDRLSEVLERYGKGTVVFDTVTESSPLILEAVGRISVLIDARR
jgi:hypothetical protein